MPDGHQGHSWIRVTLKVARVAKCSILPLIHAFFYLFPYVPLMVLDIAGVERNSGLTVTPGTRSQPSSPENVMLKFFMRT